MQVKVKVNIFHRESLAKYFLELFPTDFPGDLPWAVSAKLHPTLCGQLWLLVWISKLSASIRGAHLFSTICDHGSDLPDQKVQKPLRSNLLKQVWRTSPRHEAKIDEHPILQFTLRAQTTYFRSYDRADTIQAVGLNPANLHDVHGAVHFHWVLQARNLSMEPPFEAAKRNWL